MDPAAILGQIRYDPDEHVVEGWCWSPDAPDERMVVEVYVDDSFLVALVAAWMEPILARTGIGDGRHGFSLLLPEHLLSACRSVSARERRTGQEFARAACDDTVAFDPFAARIDRLQDQVPMLDAAVATILPPAAHPDLRPAFRALGQRLQARGAGVTATLQRKLSDGSASIHLPRVVRPKLSVILCAGSAAAAMTALAGLAPAMAECQGECLLADTGADPAVSLLPSLIRHLRLVTAPDATSFGRIGNLAADDARGEMLAFLNCGAAPSSSALIALATAPPPDTLVIGQRQRDAIRALAVSVDTPAPPVLAAEAYLGLLLRLPRWLFQALGQFDATLDATPGLACADLYLKARLIGADVAVRAEPRLLGAQATDDTDSATADRAQRLQAMLAFRRRWCGDSAA